MEGNKTFGLEQTRQMESPLLSSTRAFFGKATEYLQNKLQNAKATGTMILSLGVFEMAQAQTNLVQLEDQTKRILSGELTGKSVADNLFNEYKTNNPKNGFLTVESSAGFDGRDYYSSATTSADSFVVPSINDTLDLGDVESSRYSVMVIENKTENGKITTNESARFYSAIKTNQKSNSYDATQNERSYSGAGATPQEAIITSIATAAGLEKSSVTVANESKTENVNTGLPDAHTVSSIVQVSFGESNVVLHEVKVVLHKSETGDQYFAQVLYK